MSIKHTSTYIARSGDTLKRIAHSLHLSSWRALLKIPSNAHLEIESIDAALEVGTKIAIPPNAGALLKERSYALHSVRPLLLAHFEKQAFSAEAELRDIALSHSVPSTPGELSRALAGMQALAVEGIADIARASAIFAEIGRGIVETHVANVNDRAIIGSTAGEMTGLYWLISGQHADAWADMWGLELWTNKWRGRDVATAWCAAEQHLNTIRSVVVQQVDARIRETLALERNLLTED